MPPSSPTPVNPQIQHGPISLIPDSENNSRRALTRAASSDVEGERHPLNTTSTGYVTATGLINWRRRKKSTSARPAASSAAGKLGPGMGMQGTPARRKKRKTGTSRRIGLSSTPRGAPTSDKSHSMSSLSLSSRPDTDGSGGNDATFIIPDMASLDLTPIETIRAIDTSVDVFGIMTFIEPFHALPLGDTFRSSGPSQTFQSTHTLFGPAEDLTVPVAFPSSEIQSPEIHEARQDDAKTEIAQDMMRQSQGRFQVEYVVPLRFSSSSRTKKNGEGSSDATARPQVTSPVWTDNAGTSYADATVPLDDISASPTSRRLTVSLLRTRGAATTRFTDSRIGSRVKDCVSTPYHRRGSRNPKDDAASVPNSVVRSCDLAGNEGHMEAGDLTSARLSASLAHTGHEIKDRRPTSQPDIGLAPTSGRLDTAAPIGSNLPAEYARCLPVHGAQHSPANVSGGLGDLQRGPLSPDLGGPHGEFDDTSFGDPEPFFDPVDVNPALDPISQTPSLKTTGQTLPVSNTVSFWILPLVKGTTTPVPFLPSSQLATPIENADLSSISFQTTVTGSPRLETRSDTSSLTVLSAIAERTLRRRGLMQVPHSGGKDGSASPDNSSRTEQRYTWLGAEVLKRMGG